MLDDRSDASVGSIRDGAEPKCVSSPPRRGKNGKVRRSLVFAHVRSRDHRA
jgi:hypothetical protein